MSKCSPADFDPWPMVREVAASAARHNQDSTFISRSIPAGEINGNARPGLEIYFRDDVGPAALKPIMDFLQAREVDGFTLVVDPRAEEDVVKPVQMRGIRFQYIPEFARMATNGRQRRRRRSKSSGKPSTS